MLCVFQKDKWRKTCLNKYRPKELHGKLSHGAEVAATKLEQDAHSIECPPGPELK
jgi:hypothetical protein